MNSTYRNKIRASLIALAALATVGEVSAAAAQAAQNPSPTPTAKSSPTSSTTTATQAIAPTPVNRPTDPSQVYADQYTNWAQQNCIDERTGNTAAGAIVGGALGAIAGAALTHGHDSGALAGGAVGAVAGAEIGSSSTNCPPGYRVRVGAPAFVYDGPYPTTEVVYEPGVYRPWVWVDGRWAYMPYGRWAPVYYRHGHPRVIYRRP